MGRLNLRISDGNITPLKPVYLRFRILGGRSWDQSGQSWDLDLGPGSGPGSVPQPGPSDPSISDLVYLVRFPVKRPYAPNIS